MGREKGLIKHVRIERRSTISVGGHRERADADTIVKSNGVTGSESSVMTTASFYLIRFSATAFVEIDQVRREREGIVRVTAIFDWAKCTESCNGPKNTMEISYLLALGKH